MIAAFVVLSFCGCAQDESNPGIDTPSAAPQVETISSDRLQVVDRAGYDGVLADLHGKVVLVDFWATWCAPCVEQLPHTFAMASERHDDGLAVVTVCMEDADNFQRIEEFLAQRDSAAAINLLSREGGGSRAMEAFEIEGGALPHYKLYDRAGELRRTFGLDPSVAEQFTSEDVAAAVDALLHE